MRREAALKHLQRSQPRQSGNGSVEDGDALDGGGAQLRVSVNGAPKRVKSSCTFMPQSLNQWTQYLLLHGLLDTNGRWLESIGAGFDNLRIFSSVLRHFVESSPQPVSDWRDRSEDQTERQGNFSGKLEKKNNNWDITFGQ